MDPDTSVAAVRALRLRLDQLERENRDLKRSLYDLSLQVRALKVKVLRHSASQHA